MSCAQSSSPVGLCYVDVDVDNIVHFGPLTEHRWGTNFDMAYELSCVALLLVDLVLLVSSVMLQDGLPCSYLRWRCHLQGCQTVVSSGCWRRRTPVGRWSARLH